jgi:hypothetical protein
MGAAEKRRRAAISVGVLRRDPKLRSLWHLAGFASFLHSVSSLIASCFCRQLLEIDNQHDYDNEHDWKGLRSLNRKRRR